MRLLNRNVLVTGGANGIGKAIAVLFATEGAHVAIADIDAEAGHAVECEIRARGGRAWFCPTDVSREDSLAALFERLAREWTRLNILVNNAGITLKGALENTSAADWEYCLDTNLRAAWISTRHAVPLMRTAGGGSIINIGSTHAHRTSAGYFPYAVSKGGLEALSRYVAVEYGPEGIRANTICPGMIRSRRTREMLAQCREPEAAWKRIIDTHPLRRIGEPEDIARTALFLASDDACFITGVSLFVDGGRHVQALTLADLNRSPNGRPE